MVAVREVKEVCLVLDVLLLELVQTSEEVEEFHVSG